MKTLISVVIMIGLTAVIGAVFVGVKSFDGIVTEHPYEKGLIWDEIRNRENELGWIVEIQDRAFVAGDNDVVISVLDKRNRLIAHAEVTLLVSRPSTTLNDKYFETFKSEEGIYRSKVNFPLYGYWDIDLDVTRGGDTMHFRKRIFVGKGEKSL